MVDVRTFKKPAGVLDGVRRRPRRIVPMAKPLERQSRKDPVSRGLDVSNDASAVKEAQRLFLDQVVERARQRDWATVRTQVSEILSRYPRFDPGQVRDTVLDLAGIAEQTGEFKEGLSCLRSLIERTGVDGDEELVGTITQLDLAERTAEATIETGANETYTPEMQFIADYIDAILFGYRFDVNDAADESSLEPQDAWQLVFGVQRVFDVLSSRDSFSVEGLSRETGLGRSFVHLVVRKLREAGVIGDG